MLPNFTYQVDGDNTVKIFDGINDDGPLIVQPTYPNGDTFEDKANAEKWATEWIENWWAEKKSSEQAAQRKEEAISLLEAQGYTIEEIKIFIK